MIVFRDRQSLREHRPAGQEGSESYFRASPDLNYIVQADGEKPSRNIMREYSRQLMRDSLPPLPLWLETGMTEYFSAYSLIRLGEDRIARLGFDGYDSVSEKKFFPLETLLGEPVYVEFCLGRSFDCDVRNPVP